MTKRINNLTTLFRGNKLAIAGAVVIAVVTLLAMAAPIVSPYDPYAMDADAALAGPSAAHWFGADAFGRDILSRVIYGARTSLQVGLVSVAIALTAGTIIGLLAGYFGGWIDAILSRINDGLLAFPDILLALAIMAVLGASTRNVMIAIGIVYTPIFARIARGAVLQVRGQPFIEAARALGLRHGRIMLRHVLPNASAPLIVQTTLSLAFAILAEAALSFLGLGVEPDAPSWGVMLNDGKEWMELAWWIPVFPGLAITLAVFSLNVVGDALRDAFDPAAAR
ncbi:MAG TPA: ABC transporter permease [Tepidisphaeraceae bacterium]|jgi:peptide/nickel transport system permease protein|nr:ABC transporter permease [Tepidisphaeraceae bacterium]